MTDADLAALKAIYSEWERGNWRPRFDVYAPDMEWGWSDEFPGLEGVGPDGVERSDRLRQWLSPWETGAARPRISSSATTRSWR
jgi:hypothetical protein